MQFEIKIIEWLQSISNQFWDFFFQMWTIFGEELVIIAILGFLYWCYNKKVGEEVGITVFVSLVLNSVIKVIVARPRPYVAEPTLIDNIRPATATGFSFPSGHTQGAATVFGSLAVWLKKRWITIASVIIIAMVALSRMYLGAHYLSDVLVGALLGVGLAFGFHHFLKKTDNKQRVYLIALIGSTVVFLAAFIVYLFVSKSTDTLSNAQVFYNSMEGVAKMFGAIVGFVIGIRFENQKVHFDNHRILWKNGVRFILGVAIVMGVRIVAKEVFSFIIDSEALQEGQMVKASLAIVFDIARYFLMVAVGIGIYPLLFKKANI